MTSGICVFMNNMILRFKKESAHVLNLTYCVKFVKGDDRQ